MTCWLGARFRGMFLFCIVAVLLLHKGNAAPPANSPPGEESSLQHLQSLNSVIGEWRGTGQLRRGSAQGAWRQTGTFVWDFSKAAPAIRYLVTDGKYVREGRISWNADAKKFELLLQTPEGKEQQYQGEWKEGRLEFVSASDSEGIARKVTITPLNEKRTLVLHEKTSPQGEAFFRVAEVGYTREGTHLASEGGGRPECIVTGGAGTMPVTYKGETYYVCCSGCRQAFQDNPEKILAEFRERLKKRPEVK